MNGKMRVAFTAYYLLFVLAAVYFYDDHDFRGVFSTRRKLHWTAVEFAFLLVVALIPPVAVWIWRGFRREGK